MTTENTTNTNLPPCPLTDCEGGEHHYHETRAHGECLGECEDSGIVTTRCYSQHRPGLSEPGSLPEITDEMVERATSIFIGASDYAAPGMRDALTGFRAELLAGGTRWQPIELAQIRAGMRIRAATTPVGDRMITYTGVAHHTNNDGNWLTERGWSLTSCWPNPTIYEVDPATIPADPDADLIEAVAETLYRTSWPSDMWDGLSVEAYRELAKVALAAVRESEATA